jgi:hypothetical protein
MKFNPKGEGSMKSSNWIRWSLAISAVASLLPLTLAGNADFDRLLSLKGEWVRAAEDGTPADTEVVSIWRVTAAGTTVMETLFPGAEHEMVTAYHTNGDDGLAMTHYCAGGNQPRMEAAADGGEIHFVHAGGDNVDDENVGHMHEMTLKFIDENHVVAHWSHHADGKEDHGMTFNLVRKDH